MALDYDNSAFYYFTLTLLAFYVIPTTWYVTKSVMAGMFGMCREREAFENLTGRTEAERRKLAKLKEKRASAKTLLSTKFVVHSILLILAYVICFNIVTRVQIDSDLATYDPFAVRFVTSCLLYIILLYTFPSLSSLFSLSSHSLLLLILYISYCLYLQYILLLLLSFV